jgi:hypothetical protein
MNAAQRIDEKVASLPNWRGHALAQIRRLVHEEDPAIVETWKWMGTPVWEHDGIVCLANAHKNWIKVTFPKGAQLKDPEKTFNAELEGNAWRAINLFEGDRLNEAGFKRLVRAAIELNGQKSAKATRTKAKPAPANRRAKRKTS